MAMISLPTIVAATIGSASQPLATTVAASDGTVVHLYEYRAKSPGPLTPLLMFHQAGGDARGELGPIAERMAAQGRTVFTVDLRSGGNRFGGSNATAAAFRGTDGGYCAVYPDLVAALDRVSSTVRRKVVVVGSSYSAALAVKLAAEHPQKVAAFAAFSPAGGEPMKGCEPEQYLVKMRTPGIAVRSKGADEPPAWVVDSNQQWSAAGYPVTIVRAEGHGASLLLAERTKGDVAGAWAAFNTILDKADAKAGEAQLPGKTRPKR